MMIKQIERAKEQLASKNIPVRIITYTKDATLSSDEHVTALKGQLVDAGAVVPRFNGTDPASFSLNTIQERMNAFRSNGDGELNVVSNIQSMSSRLIEKGQKTVIITCENHGRRFHTRCVYDGKGVVYDNMLSNLAFVEVVTPLTTKATLMPITPSGARGGVAELSRTEFKATVLDYTLRWIWGSPRGYIQIYHSIIWNGVDNIERQTSIGQAGMDFGDAKAETRNTALDARRFAEIAWGYGWATPTASFRINFNMEGGSFEVSLSGVGSKGSGAGHHIIYIK